MAGARIVALLAVLATAIAEKAAVTPVQKVVQLMNNMVEKGKQEKHEEQVQFAAFKTFCDSTTVAKQNAIKEANQMTEKLQADIQKYDGEALELTNQIAKHDEDIATWEGDYKAASQVRETENIDYIATHKDYTESINALTEGIAVMKKQAHDVAQSAALVQLASSPLLPEDQREAMHAFLHHNDVEDENLAVAAPESNAYEFQSQGLIDMLDKLRAKFEDERSEMEKQEVNAKHAYDMLSQDLRAQIDEGNEGRAKKSEAKGKALQASADAKGDLSDTTTTRDDDTKYLTDLVATCTAKSAAFEERQKLRGEEIVAIEKAIEIISSGAVSGASEEHLPQLMQVSALAQFRDASRKPMVQLRVAAYLKQVGTRLNSRVISALATRVSDDPFKKVKKMIKDLIVKLMEEANEEAEHKGWCDTEMSTNEQTRKEKTEAVEMLTAEIDELTASVSKLSEEITELTKAVGALDAAVAKATGIRMEEKAKNKQTIKDAQEAQTAVAQALSVLKEFYQKAGEATALSQLKGGQPMPEVFSDEPYRGMGAESGGVVGMIEVIQSDFARLESETTAAEAQSLKEYDDFMEDSSVDKAAKTTDIDHKTSKKQNQETALQEKKGDLDGTQKELDAAMAYFDKLKPSCVDAGESYEDRVARRKEEIESLQEALRILNGEG
jgi:chromosome segregation ATPase